MSNAPAGIAGGVPLRMVEHVLIYVAAKRQEAQGRVRGSGRSCLWRCQDWRRSQEGHLQLRWLRMHTVLQLVSEGQSCSIQVQTLPVGGARSGRGCYAEHS